MERNTTAHTSAVDFSKKGLFYSSSVQKRASGDALKQKQHKVLLVNGAKATSSVARMTVVVMVGGIEVAQQMIESLKMCFLEEAPIFPAVSKMSHLFGTPTVQKQTWF